MKALRNLLIFLVLIIVVGFFVPADLRNGYLYYWYGSAVDSTSGDVGKAADAYKQASGAMPANPIFARAYARALNDIAEGLSGATQEQYYGQAYDFSHKWIEEHKDADGVWQLWVEEARGEWGQGKKAAAKHSIDTAVDLMPTDYTALVYQGIIWRDQMPGDKKMVDDSIPVFEQAIEVRRETRTAWAHYELAVAYKMIKDENRALAELAQATAQWPDRALRTKIERLKHELESGGRSEK
jgi:tetratricopeptide (TPR) repeat protein